MLTDPRVASLTVVERLGEVIEWHRRELVPVGAVLNADDRCAVVEGDFFALVAGPDGLDPRSPRRLLDAIVIDIDHSPRHHLHPSHAAFYDVAGTRRLAEHVRPGGVVTVWSNDPPDEEYLAVLREVFVDVRAEVITFPNPLQDRDATNTVFLARRPVG